MILSYYLFPSSPASRYSLDHHKVSLANIIAPTGTAQIQTGETSLFFNVIKWIYAIALKLSPSRRDELHISSSGPEISELTIISFIPHILIQTLCLYYILTLT
jgi:hypothetical protein